MSDGDYPRNAWEINYVPPQSYDLQYMDEWDGTLSDPPTNREMAAYSFELNFGETARVNEVFKILESILEV